MLDYSCFSYVSGKDMQFHVHLPKAFLEIWFSINNEKLKSSMNETPFDHCSVFSEAQIFGSVFISLYIVHFRLARN